MPVTIEKPFAFTNTHHRRSKADQPGKVPQISRLLALAMRYDQLLRTQTIPNFNALCQYAGVSKPRMTQILNLLNLAPDIQAELLTLPKIHQSRGNFTERKLRPIAQETDWAEQRKMWTKLHSDIIIS